MRKHIVAKVTNGYNTLRIMQVEHHGQVSFLIGKMGGGFIGKTKDGGYKSKASAKAAAKNLL